MSALRYELINAAINKAYTLTDFSIHDNIDKRYEFRKKTILDDKSLTKDEKSVAIRSLTSSYDSDKLNYNSGKKRICENCQLECLATSFCELCVRNYLKANFSNWTSGNNDIDDLIQKCQIETIFPFMVVEWIPYNNFQNIKYLTEGGFSEIYTSDWIGGSYFKWDSKEQQLKRTGTHEVILKRLENVKGANRNWFDEAKSHLSISSKWSAIAQCLGLTQNPSNEEYMLVMCKGNTDLRNYLKQNHNQLTWNRRISISYNITRAVYYIHLENAIHRDLHSGNVLYLQSNDTWYISDLGFCGPADKQLGSIYGNLPYIAPEVISGKGYTFASDVYSIGMLMWEISTGQPPFSDFKNNDPDLALSIVNGIRPKIGSGIPLEYKEIMQQCWDADPKKRPDIRTLFKQMEKLSVSYNENEEKQTNNSIINLQSNTNTNPGFIDRRFSKTHVFEGLPEPRNATEEEQEDYYSKQYGLVIPDDIESMESENQIEQNDCTNDDEESLNNKFKKIQLENDKDVNK